VSQSGAFLNILMVQHQMILICCFAVFASSFYICGSLSFLQNNILMVVLCDAQKKHFLSSLECAAMFHTV